MSECKLRIVRYSQDSLPEDTFSVGERHPRRHERTVRAEKKVSGVTVVATHGRQKGDVAVIAITGPFTETLTVQPSEYGSRLISKEPPISLDFNHVTDSLALHPRKRI